MAGQMSIMLRADPAAFESGISAAIDAIREWEQVTDRSADNAASKLEDAIQAVVDLGDKTGRSGDEIKRALEGLGLTAEDAEAAFDAVRRSADTAGDKTGEVGDKAGEVGDALRSVGDIARSALEGDVVGAAESAVDAVGALLGAGALGGIVGIAVSAAGTAGIGLITAALEESRKKAEELKEQAGAWADAYIESGGRVLSFEAEMAKVREIITTQWSDAETNAKNWGVTVETAISAMAGSRSALDEVAESLEAQAAAMDANARGADNYAQNIEQATTGSSKANDAYLKGKQTLEELTGVMDQGAIGADVYGRMMRDAAESADAVTIAVDQFGNKLVETPDGKRVVIESDTGRATENLNAYKGDLESVPKSVDTVARLDTSAVDGWQPARKYVYVQAIMAGADNVAERALRQDH